MGARAHGARKHTELVEHQMHAAVTDVDGLEMHHWTASGNHRRTIVRAKRRCLGREGPTVDGAVEPHVLNPGGFALTGNGDGLISVCRDNHGVHRCGKVIQRRDQRKPVVSPNKAQIGIPKRSEIACSTAYSRGTPSGIYSST